MCLIFLESEEKAKNKSNFDDNSSKNFKEEQSMTQEGRNRKQNPKKFVNPFENLPTKCNYFLFIFRE